MTNPLYGVPGLRAVAEEKLKDPQRLPLFIAIDAFMNETTALVDYIVPDTHNFESWGFSAPWAGVASKATTARWYRSSLPPPQKPLTVSQRQWKHFALRWRSVLICQDLAKTPLPMLRVTAIHSTGLRTITCACTANIAFLGNAPVAEAISEDLTLTGVQRILPVINQTLKADEVSRVAFVYSRGGRFAPDTSGRAENRVGQLWEKPLQIWNAEVAAHRHAITGERYSGCPAWYPVPDCPTDALSKRFSRDSSTR